MATHKLIIYGASDDLIEIEGDFDEELNHYPSDDDDSAMLAVSDGTLLRVEYDKDGVWRFTPIVKGAAEYSKTEGVPDSEKDYTDRVTLTATKPFTYVLLGEKVAKGEASR